MTFAPVKLDRAHHLGVRQCAGAIFEIEARHPERLRGRSDLARDSVGRADVERTALDFLLELRLGNRRPAAFAADLVVHRLVAAKILHTCAFVGLRHMPGRMHRNLFRGPAELREGAMVEIDVGLKPFGVAADNGER